MIYVQLKIIKRRIVYMKPSAFAIRTVFNSIYKMTLKFALFSNV